MKEQETNNLKVQATTYTISCQQYLTFSFFLEHNKKHKSKFIFIFRVPILQPERNRKKQQRSKTLYWFSQCSWRVGRADRSNNQATRGRCQQTLSEGHQGSWQGPEVQRCSHVPQVMLHSCLEEITKAVCSNVAFIQSSFKFIHQKSLSYKFFNYKPTRTMYIYCNQFPEQYK